MTERDLIPKLQVIRHMFSLLRMTPDQYSLFFITLCIFPAFFSIWLSIEQHSELVTSIGLIITLLLITKIQKLTFLLLLIFSILNPIQIYSIIYYGYNIDSNLISIVMSSNKNEVLEFTNHFPLLKTLPLLLFYYFIIFYSYSKSSKKINIQSKKTTIMLIILALVFLVDRVIKPIISTYTKKDSGYYLKIYRNKKIDKISNTYPFGIILKSYFLYLEGKEISDLKKSRDSFSFHAKATDKYDNANLIVLVLGETGRKRNWSLYGYNRKTTPLLDKQDHLIKLSDVVSLASATQKSIQFMITRKDTHSPEGFNEKSILSAFKEVGYHTIWLSSQPRFGFHDSSTTTYAEEADDKIFISSEKNQKNDSDLIAEFEKLLTKNSHKNLFLVVHTMGSHFDYSERYPDNFNIFIPSLTDHKKINIYDPSNKSILINTYDNSLRHVDYVLDKFIKILDHQKKSSVLVYSADHGEDLFDAPCKKILHGSNTKLNYQIPAFVWFSSQFENHQPNLVTALQDNKNHKTTSKFIFPTLLDAAKIDIPATTANMSLFRNNKLTHRLVHTKNQTTVNYDEGKTSGECNEFME